MVKREIIGELPHTRPQVPIAQTRTDCQQTSKKETTQRLDAHEENMSRTFKNHHGKAIFDN